VSGKLPRIEIKPVVGNLNLVSIHDLLLENAISVSQTITPRREVQRCHGIQEASSKSAKTAISKSSIMFLTNDILDAESELGEAL
jgi:hypothetical protein